MKGELQMSNKNYEETFPEDSGEIMEEPVIETEAETKTETVKAPKMYGTVTDCLRLNIRKKPCKEAEVVTLATCLDEVEIDPDASEGEWYAVCTASGIEGFCMKKFISVGQ